LIANLAIWHASLTEIMWFLIGVIGMYFGIGNVRASRQDMARMDKLNGRNLAAYKAMRVIAFGHFRNDCFRLAKHCMITLIGLIAMLLPPTNKAQPVTPTGLVITVGLFTISMLIVLASVFDKRQRDFLEEQ